MPREKKYYRDQLGDIIEYFRCKRSDDLLTVKEISEYLGISTRSVINKLYIDNDSQITVGTLARLICE